MNEFTLFFKTQEYSGVTIASIHYHTPPAPEYNSQQLQILFQQIHDNSMVPINVF